MNRKKFNLLLLSSISLLFAVGQLSCSSSKSSPESNSPLTRTDWQIKMQKISASFSELLPVVLSSSAYNDPDNFATIQRETKNLSLLAHDLSMKGAKLTFDHDPALEFVSREFSQDMARASDEFKSGHRTYARILIQNTANYCISCHTRTDQGSQNILFSFDPDLLKFKPIERANFYAAVRQFDRALDEYDRALTDPKFAEENPREWALGAKKSLAIAVRVKRNPSLALELVSRIIDAKTAPEMTKEVASAWRQSIKEWRNSEKAKPTLTEGKRLVTKAQALSSTTPSNDGGLVYYLRASTIFHELLRGAKTSPGYAEALYYAGMASEGLKEINLWTFDEAYYEACVKFKPHSEIARRCYSRFEALQLFIGKYYADEHFAPSLDVKKKLTELKTLAY